MDKLLGRICLQNIMPIATQTLFIVTVVLLPTTVFGATISFDTMLAAIEKQLDPIRKLVFAIGYVSGFWFVVSALFSLKESGQSHSSQSGGVSKSIIKFMVGIFLIYLPSTINIGLTSLFGGSSILSYSANSVDPYVGLKRVGVLVMQIIGFVSVIRGLIMLSHSTDQGSQQGSFGKGLMHIIAGIVAINLLKTVQIVANSLGFTFNVS